MRRLALLLLACFLLTCSLASAQAGDSDGDGTRDEFDMCPTAPGPDRGCPPGGAPTGPSATDEDGDGVPNEQDECPYAEGDRPDGCGAFRADINAIEGKDLPALARDGAKNGQVQCFFSKSDLCTFRAKLTLTPKSAKRLKIKKRVIANVTITTNKEQKRYGVRFALFRWGFSPAVKRALKKADSAQMTLSGSVQRGSEKPVVLKPKTFTSYDGWGSRSPVVALSTEPERPEPSDE